MIDLSSTSSIAARVAAGVYAGRNSRPLEKGIRFVTGKAVPPLIRCAWRTSSTPFSSAYDALQRIELLSGGASVPLVSVLGATKISNEREAAVGRLPNQESVIVDRMVGHLA